MEWIIIIGLAIALYIVIYKYEKKIDKLNEIVQDNKENIERNQNKLDEHFNHIEKLWLNVPSDEKNKKNKKKEK